MQIISDSSGDWYYHNDLALIEKKPPNYFVILPEGN